nr:uncharacterized protein LOC117276801 [Nicotiana tomentosiformis]
MRSLWDELNSSYVGPTCSCGALSKFIEDQQLFQFLNSLNESYTTVKSAIMLMNPLPPISKAYSLLQQDESQREAHSATLNFSGDATSFLVSPGTPTTNRNFSQKVNFEARKTTPNVSCKYCKKPGHTVDKCYRLHGFPTDFKFTKNKKYASCVQTETPPATAISNTSTYDASTVDQSALSHFAGLFSKYAGPSLKRPLKIGKYAGKLYYLPPDADLFPVPSGSMNVSSSSSIPNSVSLVSDKSSHVVTHVNDFVYPTTSFPSSYPTLVVSTSQDAHIPSTLSLSPLYASPLLIPSPPPLRKSTRTVQQPSYLKDYVCSSVSSTNSLPTSSKVSSVDTHMHEPQFYQQAASHPAWQEAMLKEFQALENAFLHGDLHEEVYTKVSPGLDVSAPSSSPPLVCRLKKSLYGLRQAFRQWFSKLFEALQSRGYISSMNDYSLFTKVSSDSLIVLAVYVDDILLAGNDIVEMNSLKSFLDAQFKIKDLGLVHYFLGLEISLLPQGYVMSQYKYTSDLLFKFNFQYFSPVMTPLDPSVKLVLDMGFCETGVRHGYLLNDPAQGVILFSSSDLSLTAYSDSNSAACAISRKSVIGYYITLGGNPISWKSKKQPTISVSSAEAEYIALRKVSAEVSWLLRLLHDLGSETGSETGTCGGPIIHILVIERRSGELPF